MIEDELFFAWLDGELDEEQAARVKAQVDSSPELTERADEYRRLNMSLHDAFAPVLKANVPPPQFQTAEIIDFGARAAASEKRSWFVVPQWAAMAATLALGLVVGNMVDRVPSSPVAVEDGQLVAAASLDRALDTRLASVPVGEGARIGLTFRDFSGRICRSFVDRSASGLACQYDGAWRIQGLFQGGEGQASGYRMATGQDPRLAALIGETIAGEPFNAAQEKAAMEKGWH